MAEVVVSQIVISKIVIKSKFIQEIVIQCQYGLKLIQQLLTKEQLALKLGNVNVTTKILWICLGVGMFILFIGLLTRPEITMKNKSVVGLPFASIIYTDEKGCKLLVAERYDLQGKPDYIFQTLFLGKYIPFEIKSGINHDDIPHEGDMMQLVAYFLIIEEVYGVRPPYGKLVYANKTFKIRNTTRLRNMVKTYIKEMQETLVQGPKVKCNKNYIKCRNCICNQTVCECERED